MTEEELNARLIRLDERTANIWRALDHQEDGIKVILQRIETHQIKQNDSIAKSLKISDRNKTAIKYITAIGAALITALYGLFFRRIGL